MQRIVAKITKTKIGVFSHLVMPNFFHPMDYTQPDSSVLGFFRQEYWNGLPFPPPGIFLTQNKNIAIPKPGELKQLLSASYVLEAKICSLFHTLVLVSGGSDLLRVSPSETEGQDLNSLRQWWGGRWHCA